VPPSSFALRLISFAALACVGCAREPESSRGTAPKASAKPAVVEPAKKPTIAPAEAMAKLGPVLPEHEHHEPPPPTEPLKTEGKLGEVLEGDISHFKLLSMRPCVDDAHPAPSPDAVARKDPKARRVVAAEIEVVAKTRLNVAPRDLSLAAGGISINSNVDPKREIKGCTPLLKFQRIQAKETARGFVLFELPTWGPGSNLNEFKLVYHPARFGGAVALYVKLADVKLADG
jgi:hypothetical protein